MQGWCAMSVTHGIDVSLVNERDVHMVDKSMYYIGICPNEGKKVLQESGLSYAMRQCGIALTNEFDEDDRKEFIKDFEQWYFSGNWVLEEIED